MKSSEESLAQISAAEWLIMECLWTNGPMYMADIVSALKEQTEWSRTTVLTLASRLEKKEFIGTERSSKAYLYVPIVSRKLAVMDRLEQFVKETFAGDYYPLARLIAESSKLSIAEEKKLRARFKPVKTEESEAPEISKLSNIEEPLAQRKLSSESINEPKLKEKLKDKAKNKSKPDKDNSDKDKKSSKKSKKK